MIGLAAALRIDSRCADNLGLPGRPTGLVLCEDGDIRTALAADLSLVEMLGYLDLRPGEIITLQPQAFAHERIDWPSPAGMRGGLGTAKPSWTAPTSKVAVARKSRVDLLIRCLEHYARKPASGSQDAIAAEIRQVLSECDSGTAIDVDQLLPSEEAGESDYYDVSLGLFRTLADREGELGAFEIALAACGLPEGGGDEPDHEPSESTIR